MILLVLGKGQRCSEVLIDVVAGAWHGFTVFWSAHMRCEMYLAWVHCVQYCTQVVLLVVGEDQYCLILIQMDIVAGAWHGLMVFWSIHM